MCSAAAAAHSAALLFAPGEIQSTRNDLGLMQEDVFVLNAAVWLCTTFLTARFSRGPEQAEGCAAAERAVCKLGSPEKGKNLKTGGESSGQQAVAFFAGCPREEASAPPLLQSETAHHALGELLAVLPLTQTA